ncbi:hypothetical protein Hanom_Chr16g01461951 [Helianthus anomalus]
MVGELMWLCEGNIERVRERESSVVFCRQAMRGIRVLVGRRWSYRG